VPRRFVRARPPRPSTVPSHGQAISGLSDPVGPLLRPIFLTLSWSFRNSRSCSALPGRTSVRSMEMNPPQRGHRMVLLRRASLIITRTGWPLEQSIVPSYLRSSKSRDHFRHDRPADHSQWPFPGRWVDRPDLWWAHFEAPRWGSSLAADLACVAAPWSPATLWHQEHRRRCFTRTPSPGPGEGRLAACIGVVRHLA